MTGYLPADGGLGKALKNADIVVIPAGVPRKPGMTRDDLFNVSISSSLPTFSSIRLCLSNTLLLAAADAIAYGWLDAGITQHFTKTLGRCC